MIETRVEHHSLLGWQIICSQCGNCGGNYNDQDVAELFAKEHAIQPHEKKT